MGDHFRAQEAGWTMTQAPTAAVAVEQSGQITLPDAPSQTSTPSLRIQLSGLRDRAVELGPATTKLHRKVTLDELSNAAAGIARERTLQDLLDELYEEFALSWTEIAAAVHVTASAVRKWRQGGPAQPDKKSALAGLLAMLKLLRQEVGIVMAEPAAWLISPVVPDSTITVLDIYRSGQIELVLDLAYQRIQPTECLDAFNPSWRQTSSRRFETYMDEEGVRSLRLYRPQPQR